MKFTIVTPSFKQLDYLECCIASVADQGAENGGRRTEDGGQGARQKQASILDFGFWILNFKRSREEKTRKAGERKTSGTDGQLTIEHIVQDAGSPGIEEFAEKTAERLLRQYGGERVKKLEPYELVHLRTPQGYALRIFKEPDEGMYDAINKGLQRRLGRFVLT